tara:strand:+ start:33000 stop:33908 length:909 start_codon:yes stop_codon:yes gene_type:complete
MKDNSPGRLTTMKSLELEFQGEALCRKLGGTWQKDRGLCLCPAHDDHNPSLSIRVGRSALLFKCFAGCDTRDVLRAIRHLRLPFADRHISDLSRNVPSPHAGAGPALRIWNASASLVGTPAQSYLSGRLLTPPWHDLRYNLRTPLGRGSRALFRPAMIAAVRERRRLVAIHRTFIDAATATKAKDLADPRMMLGRPGRGAVQLMPPASVLGLAEGIETALAAMQMHKIPVWAVLGTERAGHILLPDWLERLVLLFDRDEAGWKANKNARLAYERPGLEIISAWPPPPNNDWADVLEGQSRAA